ncbi:NUDIX domain-containing protein [Lacticaseibacillus mingshuiensis]|uniref:NUDIX domain-containing protein n=1 Tax=Lacticaseibacillus mingshuiensis TaxID=2799574 RepID=A0ABW4CKE0_9LACO|nr:NUDIX domain-containing protein [Lacticaseibacillus mingshuiensis]
MKQLTLILVATPTGLLVINRKKPPYQGCWNALGGKVEPGETPAVGAARELFEESGLRVSPEALTTCGLVHWHVDGKPRGDLFLYTCTTATAMSLPTATREGVLMTFSPDWLADPRNLGVVPDLQAMLPLFFAGKNGEWTSRFAGDQFLGLEATS